MDSMLAKPAETRPREPIQAGHPRRWAATAFLFLASFMNLIDITIVYVALPSMQTGLGATSTQLEWVSVAHILTFAMLLLPLGRSGDVFGRKRMLLLGIVGFTLSSALCGIAPNITTLILARAVQGIAGALMVPQVLAIVHVIFPPEEKGRAFALFALITSLGSVAGPILGGAIISADLWGLGWRPIFLINLPLGLFALIGALRTVPHQKPTPGTTIDMRGAVLFAISILLLVFPLIEGRTLGWPYWCFAILAASVPAALLFWRSQVNAARQGRTELLPVTLLTNRAFLSGLGIVTLLFSGIPGLFFVLTLFFQSGFGLTPLASGLATAPFPIGVMIASTLTGRFGTRWLAGRVALGAGILAVGMAALQFVTRGTGEVVNTRPFIVPLLICGVGMGIAVAALFQNVLGAASKTDAGAGSGTLQTFQQVGSVLGIAIVGQLFFTSLGDSAPSSPDFVRAATTAIWYPISAFAAIALLMVIQLTQAKKGLGNVQ